MRVFLGLATLSCAVLLAGADASAQQQPSCTGREGPLKLYVDVEGVRSGEGLVAVTRYADDSSRFLAKRGSLYVGRVPAKAGETRVCIFLPAAGTYALAAYHDADADRKYDRTAVGLPAESYGFSNNPAVFLGMPAFSSVRLAVPRTNMTTRITLRHP